MLVLLWSRCEVPPNNTKKDDNTTLQEIRFVLANPPQEQQQISQEIKLTLA
jgi:hypothetical protein